LRFFNAAALVIGSLLLLSVSAFSLMAFNISGISFSKEFLYFLLMLLVLPAGVPILLSNRFKRALGRALLLISPAAAFALGMAASAALYPEVFTAFFAGRDAEMDAFLIIIIIHVLTAVSVAAICHAANRLKMRGNRA
jgi:cytochrome c biogenesis factor